MVQRRRTRRKSSRSLWLLLVLLALVAVLIMVLPGCGSRNPKSGGEADLEATTLAVAGSEAPDFTVTLLDGSTVTLSELRGEPVLLLFWATWCPACREEMAVVPTEIVDRFAGRPLHLLAISREESAETVAAYLSQGRGSVIPAGLDPDRSIYDRYASQYIPRSFLIDAEGRVVRAEVGYEPETFAELVAEIEKLLDKQ